MTWLAIAALVVAGVALLVVLPFLLSYLGFRRLGRTSGLNKLAEIYPASSQLEGGPLERQWVGVGKAYYRKDGRVRVLPEGLYLWVRPFLGSYKPALMPWNKLRDPQPTILALRQAVRLTVGDPAVTSIIVTAQFFERIRPYLHS